MRAPTTTCAAALAVLLGATGSGAAESSAWIAGRGALHLRSGAGTEYRSVGLAEPADTLTLLGEVNGWTQVRLADGSEGWVASSELTTVEPDAVKLATLAHELDELRERLGAGEEEADRLREDNERLGEREAELDARAEDLERKLVATAAAERWREWVTGAGIALVGALAGALWGRLAGRRRGQALRLD